MRRSKNQTKNSIGLVLALLGILAIVVVICLLTVRQSNKIITEETRRSLDEAAEQSALRINQQIDNDLIILKIVSKNLSMLQDTPSLAKQYLLNIENEYSFSWVGITDQWGNLSRAEYGDIDTGHIPVVQAALKGKTGVGRYAVTVSDGQSGILYATPYYQDERIIGATVAWVSGEVLSDLLANNIFDGEGFIHIIFRDGDFVVRSENKNVAISGDNFFAEMEQYGDFYGESSFEKMYNDMMQGKSGYFYFTLKEQVKEAISYIPLENSGWYLLTIVPMNTYGEKIDTLTHLTVMTSISVFMMFLALIIAILYINKKNYGYVQRLAYEDPVTGGFTTQRFTLEFEERLQNFTPFVLISLDIRRFKLINDMFGSSQGDRVLHYVHDHIDKQLQQGEFLARVSSDLFNLVLNTTDKEQIEKRLQDISMAVNQFNEEAEMPYYFTLDCGIYVVNTPDVDIITVRDRANTARKRNKQGDNNHHYTCVFYSDVERLELIWEQEMENAAERALESGEFVVFLQPKVSTATGKIVGAEALSRWNWPGKDMIYPSDYIPVFERNGFIRQLDLYTFQQVCMILRRWLDAGLTPPNISVNLSRSHLQIPNFLDSFKAFQQQYQIPTELIEFELTETVVVENLELLKQVIQQIHQSGFRCSMDDFGSGYSSLDVLREVHVDVLKLDRGFFLEEDNQRGNEIVSAVIGLAQRLGIDTVAEGIETMEQVEFLRLAGCDMIQGYVYSKPVPVEVFEQDLFDAKLQ